jgi:DNA-binding beta-propeller fold protein YncE
MLAIAYLVVVGVVGDALARRWFGSVSPAHRVATAILVGLPIGAWASYLAGLVFQDAADPLLPANGAAVAILIGLAIWSWRRPTSGTAAATPRIRAWDLATIGVLAAISAWMMLRTYTWVDGSLGIAGGIWSDFGPTTAIAQSFAVGHNFPTEYPHFPLEPIRYHFLFYFGVGNLTWLGLDPALANNVMSIGSMVAMLVVVMALGERLFRSAVVGRIGAILFFFHGSLSFIPFLGTYASLDDVIARLPGLEAFVSSGFPYRGEEWGIWTQMVFLNQRHLAGAIGLVLVIVLFLLDRLEAGRRDGLALAPSAAESATTATAVRPAELEPPATAIAPSPNEDLVRELDLGLDGGDRPMAEAESLPLGLDEPEPDAPAVAAPDATATEPDAPEPDPPEPDTPEPDPAPPPPRQGPLARLAWSLAHPDQVARATLRDPHLPGYLFCGLLAGLLPLWNGSIYVAAAAVLAIWFLVFPNRPQMVALAIVAAVVSIPQLIAIQPGSLDGRPTFPAIHWGYVLENPTPIAAASYLAFIFGPKLLLGGIALVRSGREQWRVLLAFVGLVAVAFTIQLSIEVLANHKFINAWLIVANVFAAAGLVRLWQLGGSARLPGRVVAVALALVILVGGTIDFIPVANQRTLDIPLAGDDLYEWVRTETDPDDVFLTDLFVAHPILLAGRSIYYGWPYYAWSAGYSVAEREAEYRDLFGLRSPRELVRRLQADGIDYVAIDDGLREGTFVTDINEEVYRTHLEIAFDDPDNRYRHLAIFRVPTDPQAWQDLPGAPAVDAFVGGRGPDPGRFDGPRGIGFAPDGTFAVADTLNHRVQRFRADGTHVDELGGPGSGAGELLEPNGVGLDSRGHVLVADTLHHRLVEYGPDGALVDEWAGPDPGFYGPRDVFVGPDDHVWILDQGRARVVTRAPDGTVTTIGSFGTGDGQLNDPTGLAVTAELLIVADTANRRIVTFDRTGAFRSAWPVAEWDGAFIFPDVAAAPDGRTIYASSPTTGEILVFAPDGTRGISLRPAAGVALEMPGALAVDGAGNLLVVDQAGNRVVRIPTGR